MKLLKGIATNIVSAVGGVCIPLGEIDDSPGLGGIGLILIGISIYLNVRNIKESEKNN